MEPLVPLLFGKYYHIYNRGNNGENIFREEKNYAYFMTLYSKHIEPVADTFCYCLLRNHFHLLIRIKTEEDLAGFPNLPGLKSHAAIFEFLQQLRQVHQQGL